MRSILVVALGVASCTTVNSVPPETGLPQIVDDVQHDRIDACHDRRWADWRFDAGADGIARLTQLRDLARSGLTSTTTDPYERALQAERLYGLGEMIDAVSKAPDRSAWTTSMHDADRWLAVWHAKAAAIQGDALGAAAARRAVWIRAEMRAAAQQRFSGMIVAHIEHCLMGMPGARARNGFLQLLFPMLERGQWPSDERDGGGSSMAALKAGGGSGSIGSKYFQDTWSRLKEAVRAGGIPAGALALVRATQTTDPEPPPATIAAYSKRFETEWRQAQTFVTSLSPPRNVGEELSERTLLEQYGRLSMVRLSKLFPSSAERAAALVKIWSKVEVQDKDNIARVKALLATREWFDDDTDGDGAESNGWLIVQHADLEPDFQREVLRRMEPLVRQGRVLPWDYALLWDRVAVKDKRLQRYATQMMCKDGAWVADVGVEDPDHLDARRAEMGLGPWSEYATSFGSCK